MKMNSSPSKIFVLDDNPHDLNLVATLLGREFPDVDIDLFEIRDDLFEKLEIEKPDVIVCDFRLTSCNGLDVLIDVKRVKDIPFIFCTSTLDTGNELSEIILNGANGYVLKDNVHDLPETIKEVIVQHAEKSKEELTIQKIISGVKLRLQELKCQIEHDNMSEEKANEIEEVINELQKILVVNTM